MIRRVTPSQFRSMVRQMESRQRQAIDKYNRDVRRAQQEQKRKIDRYNQEVRAHNARVRQHQARVSHALSRFQSQVRSARYQQFTVSVTTLHTTFSRLQERYAEPQTPEREELLDLSERETANSLEVANALLADDTASLQGEAPGDLRVTGLSNELRDISVDLDNRWKGALFSLSPQNPDAARHFCTSARELMDGLLKEAASNEAVVLKAPECKRAPDGGPTRRERIRFLLRRKGMTEPEAEEFVSQDVANVMELFQVFNDGTHGRAGRFVLPELVTVKRRVEDGIRFLSKIVR